MLISDHIARDRPIHPARLIVGAFAAVVAIGTALLRLPISTVDGGHTSIVDALFTATSAVCVTGLVVVDTAEHWTVFGTFVIIVLIQIGGFGIMALGTLAAVLLSRRLGLQQRLFTSAETGTMGIGEVRTLIRSIATITLAVEGIAAVFLAFGFWRSTDLSVIDSFGYGAFHSISAFNNAGFALFSDSLEGFVTNWWITGIIACAVVLGGLGFPVIVEVLAGGPPRRWSLHTRMVLFITPLLLVVGAVAIVAFEWNNQRTLGELGVLDKFGAGSFASVMPRTAGFNSVPVGGMEEATLLVNDGLMFIGAGPASTGGGIKVTTFALLGFVMWAEMRGDPDVVAFHRKLSTVAQRQAITIALAGVGVVMAATLVIMEVSALSLSDALFETISAFGTVGLSTGVTPGLGTWARLTLILMMFIGRVGPLTLGAALVIRARKRRYKYPEEGLLIG